MAKKKKVDSRPLVNRDDISEMVPNEDGHTHFVIDRVVNPDYEVP